MVMLRTQTSAPSAPYTSPYRPEVKTISEAVVGKLSVEIAVPASGFGSSTRDGAAYGETAPPFQFPPPDNVATSGPPNHWWWGEAVNLRSVPGRRVVRQAWLIRASDLLEDSAIQSSDKIPDNAAGVEFSTFRIPPGENPGLTARKCCTRNALQPDYLCSFATSGTGQRQVIHNLKILPNAPTQPR